MITIEKLTTGQKIALARSEKKLKKKELAEKIGVDPATIGKYESGEIKNIPQERLFSLAEVLEKPLEYFIEGFEVAKIVQKERDLKKREIEKDMCYLKIIIGFRDNSFTFESDGINLIYQPVPILELNGEVAGLSMQEIESQFFVWIEKKDKYVVRKCNEIADGRFYLIYDDYELKIVDMKTDTNKKQSSNFKPVGKLLKLIRDLE